MRTNSVLTPCKQGAVLSRYSIGLGNEYELTHTKQGAVHFFPAAHGLSKELTWVVTLGRTLGVISSSPQLGQCKTQIVPKIVPKGGWNSFFITFSRIMWYYLTEFQHFCTAKEKGDPTVASAAAPFWVCRSLHLVFRLCQTPFDSSALRLCAPTQNGLPTSPTSNQTLHN